MKPLSLAQVRDDDHLVELWLAGRGQNTRRAYRRDALVFRAAVPKALDAVGYEDLVVFMEALSGVDSTRARRVSAIKSLLSFGHRLGYLTRNVGRLMRTPRVRSRLHERILDEDQVREVIREAAPGRDRVLVRLLYFGGLRITEALGVRWRDVGDSWVAVFGKGARCRTVPIRADLVCELRGLRRSGEGDGNFVFMNRRGTRLSESYARRVVRRAAVDAVDRPASPHWLRHCHATHAIERGAPLHLVAKSLGHASIATTSIYLHARPGEGSSQYLAIG